MLSYDLKARGNKTSSGKKRKINSRNQYGTDSEQGTNPIKLRPDSRQGHLSSEQKHAPAYLFCSL